MQLLQQAGIELILWLQSFKSPFFDGFFDIVTQFGGFAYVLIIPLIIWCIEPRLGLRALLAMMIAQYIVMLLKDIVQEPRPFLADARIISNGEHGFSFPSGHAMGSFVFYGMLLFATQMRWLKLLLAGLIFMIGVSRSYLGVHYPHDVVAGWLLAVVFLALWPRFETAIINALAHASWLKQALFALFIPSLVGIAHYYLFDYFGGLVVAAAISVSLLALMADYRQPSTNGSGSVIQKVGRYIVGVAATLLVLTLFRNVYPAEDAVWYNLVVWCNGAAIAAMIVYIVPYLFKKLRLAV